MRNKDTPARRFKTRRLAPSVARTIKDFSESRRNLVRGIVADAQRNDISIDQINALRANRVPADMMAAAAMLNAPEGLRDRAVTHLKQNAVAKTHHLVVRSGPLEAAYACGILNSWIDESLAAIAAIRVLSLISEAPNADALGALKLVAQTSGASDYLARKLVYIKEYRELSQEDRLALSEIDNLLDHPKHPELQYGILELVKEVIPLFNVARRLTNIFQSYISSDFRRVPVLNALVATPYSISDCAGFILRATESSLLDTVLAILIILNLEERLGPAVEAIRDNLDSNLLSELENLRTELVKARVPQLGVPTVSELEEYGEDEYENLSLSIYRRSILFLEFPSLARYRNDVDQVIGHRLIAPLLPSPIQWQGDSFENVETLKRADATFDLELHNTPRVEVDTFYRTYLFMRFIQNPLNLASLSSDDIQYIFDKTVRLDTLLTENELKTMHMNASDEARALISVLALSLYRSKSSDPDIDFDFREQLEGYIIEHFCGSVSAFIEHIAPKSPEVASYIANSLDETTLQKMYTIVDSPKAAENIRKDILMAVGIHLNKIEYIIEAEAIETRAKVSKLKDYFDTSRMFVDSMAMRKWLESHPSAYTEQYRELLPKITARLARVLSKTATGEDAPIEIVELMQTDRYLIEQIVKEAFREFCVNNEFGIESYLGRRIRHNTLHGVMTNSVDAVLQRPQFRPFISGTPFGDALATWEKSYKTFIERMRREFLQFRSERMPRGLFNSALDLEDSLTTRNITQLVNTLLRSGAEMLHDLIIAFCWQQIAPQLESASRRIRVDMAQGVIQNLEQHLHRFNGAEEQKIKTELADAVASVFAQVAGWFQVPQTGFVPATIAEICDIIDIEHGRSPSTTVVSGVGLSTKYYGISVHRIYDCLAVLLQNAFKHGRPECDVRVEVMSTPIPETNLHTLEISVSSALPSDTAVRSAERVAAAITSSETGKDMVTEGYTGIKKVKFITRLNEGASTVNYEVDGPNMKIGFQIKAEVASGMNVDEENTAG